MIVNQIRRRIELCMREIILRFEINFKNLTFFLDSIIQIRIFKQVPKYFSNWAEETLGDLQSTSSCLDPGVKM
jgi:hypothetical protein